MARNLSHSMYFTPRYAQPFTLLEANALDIPIIVKGPVFIVFIFIEFLSQI